MKREYEANYTIYDSRENHVSKVNGKEDTITYTSYYRLGSEKNDQALWRALPNIDIDRQSIIVNKVKLLGGVR